MSNHQDNTTGKEKTFYMVEADYHYAAKWPTMAQAAAHAAELNKTHKNRFGHDAYHAVPYTRH